MVLAPRGGVLVVMCSMHQLHPAQLLLMLHMLHMLHLLHMLLMLCWEVSGCCETLSAPYYQALAAGSKFGVL